MEWRKKQKNKDKRLKDNIERNGGEKNAANSRKLNKMKRLRKRKKKGKQESCGKSEET